MHHLLKNTAVDASLMTYLKHKKPIKFMSLLEYHWKTITVYPKQYWLFRTSNQ